MPAESRKQPGHVPPLDLGQHLEFGVRDAHGIRWYPSRLEDRDAAAERLVTAWPLGDELQLVPLAPGQRAIVAATCQDDALYSAEVRVEGLEQREPRLVVVRAANGWQRVQRRNHVRLGVVIRPTLAERLTGAGWWPVRAVITNLSAGGVQVRSRDELLVGDRLDFGFALPSGAAELRVRLDVRHVEERRHGTLVVWEAGCQFKEPRTADCERIVQFIFAQQRAIARRARGLR